MGGLAGRAFPLEGWLPRLLVEHGQDPLRTKGILSIAGQDKQYVVQAIHMLMESSFTKPWSPSENRESRLVIVGRNIDELELGQQLGACIA